MHITNEEILNIVDGLRDEIDRLGMDLWQFSEPGLHEVKSAARILDTLRQNGFTVTHEGAAGVPTAFIAEYGSGKPVIGILTEYDALPGLANAPVPYKQPREDGETVGHACGHNLIAAGSVGAALAIKNIMEEKHISGTLRVYGGAAEETEGAKVYMAREGLFDDLDAMMHWHPYDYASTINVRTAAMSHMYIEFKGKTAHAGIAPWLGRSALDAAELFLHGINLMREHVEPTARIQYIIKDGGEAPNIVPEKASVMLTYRDVDRQRVEKHVAWIKDIAQGAAMATQTKALAVDYFGLYDLLLNRPLAERMQHHLETIGLPKYTDDEREFARTLQHNAGLEPTGMPDSIVPLMTSEPTIGGFTDVGDVSWITPTMGVVVPSLPSGIPVHTWMAAAAHGTSLGTKAAVGGAKVLAVTGIDLLTDADFLAEVRADFEKRTEGFTYKSPLPDLMKEPAGLPAEMRKHGTVADLKASFVKAESDDAFLPTPTR